MYISMDQHLGTDSGCFTNLANTMATQKKSQTEVGGRRKGSN